MQFSFPSNRGSCFGLLSVPCFDDWEKEGACISEGRYNVEPRWWRVYFWTLSNIRLLSTLITGIRRGATGSGTVARTGGVTGTLGL